ncbi:hypothetical protein [Sphingomonas hankookensis]
MDLVYYLRDAAPDLADLLLMEAEEVGGILLAACHRSGHAQFSRHNLLLNVQSNTPPIFDDDTARHLPAVLAEGWAWLERECLLIAKPNDPNWQFLGSGLVDHSQKMTVAARAIAEKKAVGQRS